MRGWPTWLIAGGLIALGAVAAADAIRPGLDASERMPQEATTEETRSGEPHGLLAVAGSDCSVAAVMLPGSIRLEPRRPGNCNGAVWSADHTLTASCTGGVTTIAGPDAGVIRLRGCAPAWRPDGAVSIIDDGDLHIARRRGRPQLHLARAELAGSLAAELQGGRKYELVEVAWHGTAAFAGIVAGPKAGQRAVILYAPEGVTAVFPEFGHEVAAIRVSPLGNMVAFRRDREIVVLDPAGGEVPIPAVESARAIAWSEDEQWVALATSDETVIARTGSREVAMRLALGGDTVEWLDSGPR